MTTYDAATYGDRIADVYDAWYESVDMSAVSLLAEFARGGRALELGIGTGRIALPLKAQGVDVHGIDASPAMVAKLREKPEGQTIPVTMGNFADVAVEGTFSLIFVAFNTFFDMPSQAEQVRCFQNVARHLEPDGVFLLEQFAPDVARFDGEQTVRAISVATDEVKLEVTRHDKVAQQILSQHVLMTEYGLKFFPVRLRYAWPAELDLMAQLAGMRLQHRWGGWQREAFTAQSQKHISIYALNS
jgi:SAM-dependent methyltransferase